MVLYSLPFFCLFYNYKLPLFFANPYKKEVNEASFFNKKTFIIQPIGHKAFGFHGTLTVLFFKRGKS